MTTVRIWDIRAFAPVERCLKVFQGVHHNFEKVNKIKYFQLFSNYFTFYGAKYLSYCSGCSHLLR